MLKGYYSFFAIICVVLSAGGTELQLKNGMVYKGKIISENGDYFSIEVGASRLAINKSLVDKKDGVHFEFLPETVSDTLNDRNALPTNNYASTKIPAPDNSEKIEENNEWTVTLVNGEIFKGRKISENIRMLVMESHKNPVTIFKNMVADIDSGKNATIPVEAPIVQQMEVTKQARSALPDPIQLKTPTTCMTSAVPAVKKIVITKPEPGDVVEKTKIDTLQSSTETTATVPSEMEQNSPHSTRPPSPRTVITVANLTGSSQIKDSVSGKDTINPRGCVEFPSVEGNRSKDIPGKTASENRPSVVKSAGNSAPIPSEIPRTVTSIQRDGSIPLPKPYLSTRNEMPAVTTPMKKLSVIPPASLKGRSQRSDGKHEILLINGTVFIGTIKNEGPGSIALSADGAVITVLKRLIKEIDGELYTSKITEETKPLKTTTGNSKSSKDTLQHSTSVKSSLFRILPVVILPTGVTINNLLDSMHQKGDWRCRSKAIRMLGAMGSWGLSALSSVTEFLSDTTHSGYPVPVWIDSSNVENYIAPGLEAARALAQLGTTGMAELIKASKMENPMVRRHAIFGMGYCFFQTSEKTVTAALSDSDPTVRRTALGSLRFSTALPALAEALKDPDGSVRSAAIFLLSKLTADESLPHVLRLYKDKDKQVRTAVATAIGTLGSESETAILDSLYHDHDNFVRAAAVRALGNIKDSMAVTILITATGDESAEVRMSAADALGRLRNSRAIPSLYAMLQDKNEMVQEKAKMAVKLHTEMPLLIDALDDESETVRMNAAYILWLLTGQDFGNNKNEWSAWAAKHSYNDGGSLIR